MTKKERIDAYVREKQARQRGEKIEKPLEICANCAAWYQHYVTNGTRGWLGGFVPISCGHCIYPRMKHRQAWDTCEHFARLKDMTNEQIFEAMQNGLLSATGEGYEVRSCGKR